MNKPNQNAKLAAIGVKVGRVYSARRAQAVGLVNPIMNDRQVVWVDALGTRVQYDSPTVGIGRRLPTVDMDAFLRWAKADVTDACPAGEWRNWASS